jgi:rhodanese-related sulfurtransferase
MTGAKIMNAITPTELAGRRAAGERIELIDVRTPVEFAEVHVDFARNVPLDQLRADQVTVNGEGPLYVICRSGSRGRQACEKLKAAGLTAVNVEGGTAAWEAAGLPVARSGEKVMSLERQVRIGAGSLVIVGVLLGAFAHPAFYALSGFVGVGLVFAGVTDWCGMGMLLARMPWNRARASSSGSACTTH